MLNVTNPTKNYLKKLSEAQLESELSSIFERLLNTERF